MAMASGDCRGPFISSTTMPPMMIASRVKGCFFVALAVPVCTLFMASSDVSVRTSGSGGMREGDGGGRRGGINDGRDGDTTPRTVRQEVRAHTCVPVPLCERRVSPACARVCRSGPRSKSSGGRLRLRWSGCDGATAMARRSRSAASDSADQQLQQLQLQQAAGSEAARSTQACNNSTPLERVANDMLRRVHKYSMCHNVCRRRV